KERKRIHPDERYGNEYIETVAIEYLEHLERVQSTLWLKINIHQHEKDIRESYSQTQNGILNFEKIGLMPLIGTNGETVYKPVSEIYAEKLALARREQASIDLVRFDTEFESQYPGYKNTAVWKQNEIEK